MNQNNYYGGAHLGFEPPVGIWGFLLRKRNFHVLLKDVQINFYSISHSSGFHLARRPSNKNNSNKKVSNAIILKIFTRFLSIFSPFKSEG